MKKTPNYDDIPPNEFDEMVDPILGKTFDYDSEPADPTDEKKYSEEPITKEVRHRSFEMAEEE